LSDVVSGAIPTVPSEPATQIASRVSSEPSETEDLLSSSNIATPGEPDRSLSDATPTARKDAQDTFTVARSVKPNENDPRGSTETRAVSDAPATSKVTELEKVFAQFSLPGRGEMYESRAAASAGYTAAWKGNAGRIGRTEKYLAIAALLIFVPSLLAYWIRPFEDVPRDPEVTAQDSDVYRPASDAQATVLQATPGAKQVNAVEWQSAFQPSSEDRSPDRGVRGPTASISSPDSAASNPSPLVTATTAEPDQVNGERPLPARKRGKAEKKKVTVDDLITDKKKITVDDLINDN
jgi:hypothetical protein